MVDRRSFADALAGTVAAPQASFAKNPRPGTCLFGRGTGARPSTASMSRVPHCQARYGVDTGQYPICLAAPVEAVSLCRLEQWRPRLGGRGRRQTCRQRFQDRSLIRRAGAARRTLTLPSRPITPASTYRANTWLTAYNYPSGLTVHRINADGTLGDRVDQPDTLDTGIIAHEIRVTPDNGQVILVTRGNNAPTDNPVDPARSDLRFQGRRARKSRSDPARRRHGSRPRHLNFHRRSRGFTSRSEPEPALRLHARCRATGLSRQPTVRQGARSATPHRNCGRRAGPIHVSRRALCRSHQPRLVVDDFEGKKVCSGGEVPDAVFAIDQTTGERH